MGMRQRISFSCTNCRKRKVKCDRKKPLCSACQRNRIPVHLCTYETSPHILKAAAENQIKLQQQLDVQQQHQLYLQQQQSRQQQHHHHQQHQQQQQLLLPSEHQSPVTDHHHNHDSYTNNHSDDGSTICNLQDFEYYKPNYETIAYFGATSWRTILKESFQYHPIVVESSRKTYLDIKSWYKQSSQHSTTGVSSAVSDPESVNNLLPSYKAMSKLLSNFLQQQDELIYKCFSSTDIFKYFNNTFTRNGKLKDNYSKIELCIILSIITLSCYLNNEYDLDINTLYAIIKYQFSSYKFQITIPELQTMVLIYELKKYDYKGELNAAFIHDINLLSSITTTATSLGLNRNIEKTHKGDISYLTSIRNLWKYILFEDTIRGFRYGHQPFLDNDYSEQQLLDDDIFNYKNRIEVMRNICKRINSYRLSKSINLNFEIEFAQRLLLNDSRVHHPGDFVDSALIQCLMQIRYLKFPTTSNLQQLFEASISLYYTSKRVLELGRTSHFLHVKETLFRAGYGILYILLDQVMIECNDEPESDTGTESHSKTKPKPVLFKDGKPVDLEWYFKFFYDEYQPLLNKIRQYSEPIRFVIISNVNALELIKSRLESKGGIKIEPRNNGGGGDTIDDDLYEFF